ncbi:MAG: hypothetical protein AAF916_08185 [Planctomycetota bacterium]
MTDQVLPVSVLEAEQQELQQVRDTLASKLQAQRSQLEDTERELTQVSTKLDYIALLMRKADRSESPSKTRVISKRGTFSRALIELVKAEPGVTKSDAVGRLFEEHKSDKAESPRRSLMTQISNLNRRGKVVVKGDQIYLPGQVEKEDGDVPSD